MVLENGGLGGAEEVEHAPPQSFVPEIELASRASPEDRAAQEGIATALFVATCASAFALIVLLVWSVTPR